MDMFLEIAEMLPDGDSYLDYFPDADCTLEYTCPFCKKKFRADGDTAELRHYYRTVECRECEGSKKAEKEY